MGLNSQLATHSDKKLSCYTTFKQNFGQEKYLRLLKKFEQRRSFTRFRISAQRLNIERRRYVGIPRQERYCTRCNYNTVDGEKRFHYAMEERDTLFELISKSCKTITTWTVTTY